MFDARNNRKRINEIIGFLVEKGLADDQNYAEVRDLRNNQQEVTTTSIRQLISLALKKNRSYAETHRLMSRERAYNLKMPDGALLQMSYWFSGTFLERHRLAFLPSPSLEEFQNSPEIYLEETLFAEVTAKNILPVPCRFDFDSRAEIYQELAHPMSHLTLGQYKNCRIPVTAPLTPHAFVDFVLRSFYNTAYQDYAKDLPGRSKAFEASISSLERTVVHVVAPDSSPPSGSLVAAASQ